MATSDSQLFDDTFTVTLLNSSKYDRVSRISGHSVQSAHDTDFTLDVNTELYPCAVGDTVNIVLASTLALDGTKDDGKGWRGGGGGGGMGAGGATEASLADLYDYVCHGKIYRFEEGEGENIKVYISFGGLLLYLVGPYKKLTPLRIDYVYLLMKK
ncbi:MAG: DNA-directed RNA polymerases I, II, and III subunit RPABC3 [Sclerophora amabilis]|nr:MAG: DNA-directed RNA polymerases I, II, and III subunit RPABC3 [Sclerophora amabilis]